VERQRDDVHVTAADLMNVAATPGEITDAGLRLNVSVGIRYVQSWLAGVGAAAIDNLMEDAATAEISRSQVWQWVRHGKISREHAQAVIREISAELGPDAAQATDLFERMALSEDFTEFLTLPAYELID
jgi:malate synthase